MRPCTDSCRPMYCRCISSPSFFMFATQPLTMPRRLTARLGSFSSTASFKSASTSWPTCCATSAYCETTVAAFEKRSRACQNVLLMASASSMSACRKARHAISKEPAMETWSFSSSLRQKIVSCSAAPVPGELLLAALPSPTCTFWCGYGSDLSPAFCSCEAVCSMCILPSGEVRCTGLPAPASEWYESSLVVDGWVTIGTLPLLTFPLETSVTMGPGGGGGGGGGREPPASQGCRRQASRLIRS
mmetsp:Transcript_54506/g.131385  ORF Transcript_54506/g.131385 Transcript_54506/m.131385 type:complete len:245 (-) Transcript_54506:931-1665(-)